MQKRLTRKQQSAKKIEIPVLEGARIFAQFDDKAPAVINYFTTKTEQSVHRNFTKNSYGEASCSKSENVDA